MNNSAAELTYPFAATPAGGELLNVAPGIFWLRMPLPFALNHINLWLLEDGDGWTIVDCGIGNDATRALWQGIFAQHLAERPVKRVIVTHHHPDHVGAAAWLAQRWQVPVWMTVGEFYAAQIGRAGVGARAVMADFCRQHGLDAQRAERQQARANNYAIGVPDLPHAIERYYGGDSIHIGAHGWRVIIGYGHAPEHASLYCAELGVLISGDQVLPRITTNVSVWPDQPEGDPLRRFLDSMQNFASLPEDTLVLPSHDRVFRGLHARLQQLQAHHRARLDEVLEACGQPRMVTEVVPVLFKRELDDHQMMFAMGETLAHLNYLWRANTLTREYGADHIYRFARA